MNYEKLKLKDLKSLADENDMPSNLTKDQIIENLKLLEKDKYIKPTTCEKFGKDDYLIGIDVKNQQKLIACGKFVENKEMKRANMYASDRVYFIASFKYLG